MIHLWSNYKMLVRVLTLAAVLQVTLTSAGSTHLRNDAETRGMVTIDGRQYYISDVKMSFGDAMRACRQLGMTLAGLETNEEFASVRDEFWRRDACVQTVGYDTRWTGDKRRIRLSSSNSGEHFSYDKWYIGEPTETSNNQACVYMYNYYTGDAECGVNNYFICEEVSILCE
ncbi:hypothetical protein B566_EDAN009606 [Ephemera danica]|nr:hypothetical protein B566_EDAN009606 [Ephemera danica]